MKVIKFLLNYEQDTSNEKYDSFKKLWDEHTKCLLQFNTKKKKLKIKRNAENELYKLISRTERITKIKKPDIYTIKENENDIKSYFQLNDIKQELIKDNQSASFDVDYIKSSPYLLSYNQYKIQREIEDYYKAHPQKIDAIKNKKWFKNQILWLDEKKINGYKYDDTNPITSTNSKANYIRNKVFDKTIKNLDEFLWIPPTLKYYNFEKPYNCKNIEKVTKTLIFSKWEIVPKMISSMLSYEMERETIFKAYNEGKKRSKKDSEFNRKIKYFENKSYIYTSARLVFKTDNITKNKKNMNSLLLLYPSNRLSSLFNPVESLNELNNNPNAHFNENMRKKIQEKLTKLYESINYDTNKRIDNTWYYLFPLIIDEKKNVDEWFACIQNLKGNDLDSSGLIEHIKNLKDLYKQYQDNTLVLGNRPKDFENTITDYIIGAPTNCVYRATKSIELATKIGYNFISLFNMQQAMAILDLCYNSNIDYWKRVLKYCYSGNLQSVIDEYFYLLIDLNGLNNKDESDRNRILLELVNDAMNIKRTTGIKIDTFNSFEARMIKNNNKKKTLRTHYAVSYTKNGTDENSNHEESIRNAFNSPFFPFVLTTTSIGQEGLDFHYYCNRIVHWNLPSNPVELEQREGRINRFKCFAIRKYITQKYNLIKFKSNIWKELFENAEKQKKDNGGMIPFWCLPDNDETNIERIIPLYEFSSDIEKHQRLKDILALYRLTLGKANQEDLLQQFIENYELDGARKKEIEKFFINLSPYYRKKTNY